jgi:GT2 family glycosyltransferase
MDLSIIILNYKSRGLVRQCVKTIELYAPSRSYEVIVVDNDSKDGTAEMLASYFPTEKFPHVRFIQTGGNIGFAAGNNVGIRASSGKYVMIMNPDITVRPGSIDEMLRFMDANQDVGVAGPKLVHPDGSIDHSCYRYPTPAIPVYRRTPLGKLPMGKRAVASYLMDDYDHETTQDVDWLLGAVLTVRRAALDKVGLLDERFFLYFEDTDWCRRFWNAGWRVVYHTGANMVHFHERLSAQGSWITSPFRKSTRIHIESCVKYFKKWSAIDDSAALRLAKQKQTA